jgi:hypothetical protein
VGHGNAICNQTINPIFLSMLMLQCSWASRCVFVTNQVVTTFLHILGLLNIMFLLLIKLKQFFNIYLGFFGLFLCC